MVAHNDTVGYIFAMWAVYKKEEETIKMEAQLSWRI